MKVKAAVEQVVAEQVVELRPVTINLRGFHAQLNGDALQVMMPITTGPCFTDQFVKAMRDLLGEREADVLLDKHADRMFTESVLLHILSKQ